jgi:hypothetical protein
MHASYRPAGLKVFCVALLSCVAVTIGASQSGTDATTELARRAEIIAVGKVSGVETQWTDDHGSIFTRVTVNVAEYLKGNAGQALIVVTPGGEIGGVGEFYSHTARFSKDEEVVVFAEPATRGSYRVTGGNRGKLTVVMDESTGVRRVAGQQPLEDLKSAIAASITRDVNR